MNLFPPYKKRAPESAVFDDHHTFLVLIGICLRHPARLDMLAPIFLIICSLEQQTKSFIKKIFF